MAIGTDERIVMTLDAGGTNFVFSAIQGNREIIRPINLPSNGGNMELCIKTIVDGFAQVKGALKQTPVAISFAFPGPADYPAGIIGDLNNLPCFRGGVALGPLLAETFGLPVFLNNDGDLFAYGEAISGFLPEVNAKLAAAGSPKRFNNLFGITLGTGFGGGIVRKGELFIGDNSAAGEIWVTRNKLCNRSFAEEGASIRAVQRVYLAHSSIKHDTPPTPKDIYGFAEGDGKGDREAAIKAFEELGEVVGDALANAITLIDGLIVVGGGLAGAAKFFLPRLVAELNNPVETLAGKKVDRLEVKAFNLENAEELAVFLKGQATQIPVPGTGKTVAYDSLKRVGVGLSRLGTSHAVSIGAYAFALNALDGR